jgi:hypothetical protein
MNASRNSSACGFFSCLLMIAIGHCTAAGPATAPTLQTAIEPIAELGPGKAPGTFHLVYRARAEFTKPGHCALVVNISERFHEDIDAFRFNDAKEFAAEADLRPGTYSVTVEPVDKKNADYWPSNWQKIHIDQAGRLYQPLPWLGDAPGVFVLEWRMRVSPADLAVADAQQPLLKWPAVAGATHYRGDFRGGGREKFFDVDETQYLIGGGLKAGEWCWWRVYAMDANGKTLGHGEGTFLGHGTDDAAIAKMRAGGGGTCGLPPQPGRPYLGIHPLSTQVPKDPKTPMVTGSFTVQDAASGFIAGILVTEVLPGSPGVDADLHPDDVIIALDGQPVTSEGNMGDSHAISEQIAAMEPGRQITLTVRRFPRDLTLHATIGRYPGGGAAATQPATQPVAAEPSTAPTAPKPNVAAAEPASHSAWSEVESGSPARHPFRAEPGADIPRLSSKDGLAADWVKCMAELPHGGIAFGTREGLSIWDGAEIRTYSGPSFSSQRRESVEGNSGLPANDIQDLLCDSRGRLWVATTYGVCRIDSAPPGTWRVLENPQRTAFSRRGIDQTHDVQTMFEASDGTIVLGARGCAITLIEAKTDTPKLIHSDGEMNHWITGIAEDSKHRLWFSVYGVGVLRYDGVKVEQIHGPWIDGDNHRGLCIDGAGTVWISEGNSLGALHADGRTEKLTSDQLAGGYIEHLSADRSGRVWATCEGGYAIRAPNEPGGKDKPWQFAGQGESWTRCALNASDGSWWISGNSGVAESAGVSRSRKLELSEIRPRTAAIERFKRETEKTYPKVKVDRRTAISPAGVVVAALGDQLLRYDGKKWEDLTAQFGHPHVYKIRTDSRGTIWIATGGEGLIGLDPAGGVRRYNNDPNHGTSVIYDIDESPDGTLYAGTQHGVYRLRGNIWEQVPSNLFQVGRVLADRRGRVWLLEITYSNLYVYDGNRFREVKDQTALSDEELAWETLRLDNAGNVLVDTRARPAAGAPRRTFKWEASAEGKIGQPVEVK